MESAKKLLENNGEATISAGLYTYAIEEYGKLIMLSMYNSVNEKVNIDYYALFGGRGSHDLKFNAAIEELKAKAPECIILAKGMFDPAIFDPKIFDTTAPIIADFKARMSIFYCGLGKTGKTISSVPLVDKKNLQNAIEKLKTIASGFS